MRTISVILLVRLGAGSLAASTLAAQVPASKDSSKATGDSLRSKGAFPLPPILITASLEPTRQDKIGFASSVVPREQLAAEPTTYAADALRRIPGVFIDESVGPGGPTVLRIRGSEEPYTKVLWDGVPININGGFLDIQGLTLANVERVEVTRGPQSALHGSSAVSGVVQFITRPGVAGPPRLELSSEGGTATENGQSGRGEVTVRGGVPHLLYSASGGLTYDRGIYALPHNAWTKEGALRLDALPLSRLGITSVTRYADIRTNLPVRNAGATRVPLDPNQRDRRHRLTSSLAASFDAARSWRHRISTTLLWDDFYYGDVKDGVMQPPDFFIPDFTLTAVSTIRRLTAEYVGTNRVTAPGGGGSLSYGASIEREDTEDDLTGDFGNSQLALDRTSKAIFAEVQAAAGQHVSLLVGTRAEKYQGISFQLTPRASVVLSLVPERFALRGSVGRAFKTPNLQQQFLDNPFTIANPTLLPETSVSWELGTTLASPAHSVHGGVTYFHQTYRNLIRTVAVAGTQRRTNKNLGESRAHGIEAELEYAPSRHWSAGANATWVKTEIVDNIGLAAAEYPLGAELPFRPAVTGSAFVELTTGRVTTVLRGTLVGKQTVLTERFTGRRVALDAYALAGATVTYDASRTLAVYARFDNLFNHYYQTGFDRRGGPLALAAGFRMSP